MPRHDAGYVPAPKRQIVPCTVCGEPVETGWKRTRPVRCAPCGEQALADNMRQISQGSGPYHERRLAGYAKMLDRMTGGSELPARVIPSLRSVGLTEG